MGAFQQQTIWIIGASQGIGRALACALAAQGASLILSARDTQALNELNRQLGGRHKVLSLDVTAPGAFSQTLAKIGDDVPDIAIYMAGQYKPMQLDALDEAQTAQMVAVNFTAVCNFSQTMFAQFKKQGRGKIVLCGSIAGYVGLPNGQPYCATKAAVNNLAESLAVEAAGTGVAVQLICPGFVDTRMTKQNSFAMPALISPEHAAAEICKGLHSKRFEIHFPRRLTYAAKFLRILPYSMALNLLKRL